MGLLQDLDLENVAELAPVEPGEYELRLLKAEDYIGKTSEKRSIRCIFTISEEPDAENIFFYLPIPSEADEEKAATAKKRRIKEFLQIFGFSASDESTDGEYLEWAGATAWAILSQEEDNEGRMRNSIKRFVAPR